MHKVIDIRRCASMVLTGGTIAILLCTSACSLYEIKSFMCQGEVRSKGEIAELADAKLKRFCLQEGLNKNEFGDPPEFTLNEIEKLWVVDYQSSDHFVRFMIDNCGATETSSGPSEKVTRVE